MSAEEIKETEVLLKICEEKRKKERKNWLSCSFLADFKINVLLPILIVLIFGENDLN